MAKKQKATTVLSAEELKHKIDDIDVNMSLCESDLEAWQRCDGYSADNPSILIGHDQKTGADLPVNVHIIPFEKLAKTAINRLTYKIQYLEETRAKLQDQLDRL